jgi:peptidoglycan/LPS O-acetylase OafA/YrhL
MALLSYRANGQWTTTDFNKKSTVLRACRSKMAPIGYSCFVQFNRVGRRLHVKSKSFKRPRISDDEIEVSSMSRIGRPCNSPCCKQGANGMNSTGADAELAKLSYIDALRGWAILLVILMHASQGQAAIDALRQAVPQSAALALPDVLAQMRIYIGSGVQLFFVVSALSLALSWHARRERGSTASMRDYFIRRFFRVAPMFYVAILLYLVLFGCGARQFAPGGIGLADVALTIGFAHIWSTNALNSVVPGDWSIGVEAMFYLVLPLLLLLRRSASIYTVLTVFLVFVAQIIHWTGAAFGPLGPPGFPSQAAVFAFGLIAAEAVRRGIAGPYKAEANEGFDLRGFGAVLLFVFLVAGLPFIHLPESILVYHVQFAVGACLLCLMLHSGPPQCLVNAAIVFVGRISFSMYILHFALLAPVFATARALTGAIFSGFSDVLLLSLYYPLLVTVTACCAAITHGAIELPGIRFGAYVVAELSRRRLATTWKSESGGSSGRMVLGPLNLNP